MSEGPEGQASSFGYAKLAEVLRPQVAVLEDVDGDMKAAAERLRYPQLRARKAREAQTGGRLELRDALREFVVGKAIDIKSGHSLANARSTRLADLFTAPKEHDLSGVSGTITDAEAGSVHGMPIEPADALVMHVGVKGRLWPPRLPHSYVILGHEVDYAISPDPTAELGTPDEILPKVVHH